MTLSDIGGLYRCLRHPMFTMPALTGRRNARFWKIDALLRATFYVVVCANLSRICGTYLFGARRHWIMTIEDLADGRFVGVTMLDAVIRFDPATDGRFDHPLISAHKKKAGARIGDGEIGFFLHPDRWGGGIALQATYALIAYLANTKSAGDPRQPILARVWAETAQDNCPAIGVLQKMGLVYSNDLSVPADKSNRYGPEGHALRLVHYAQAPEHRETDGRSAALMLVDSLEIRNIVRKGWWADASSRAE